MNSVVNEDKARIFETVLSSPGMTEKCKIVLQLSRQNILLLSRLIEAELLSKEHTLDDDIIHAFPEETEEDFRSIHEEILRKAELTEFYQKLKSL